MTLQREWLRTLEGPPWTLDEAYIEQFLRQDEDGYLLPDAWYKLLRLASIPKKSPPQIEPEAVFTAADFEELEKWAKVIGPCEDIRALSLEPEEDLAESKQLPEQAVERASVPSPAARRPLVAVVGPAFAAGLVFMVIGAGVALLYSESKVAVERQQFAKDLAELKTANEGLGRDVQAQEVAMKELSESNKFVGSQLAKSKFEASTLKRDLVAARKQLDRRNSSEGLIAKLDFSRRVQIADQLDLTSRPGFTSVAETRPAFSWTDSPNVAFELQVFERGKNIVIAKATRTLNPGETSTSIPSGLRRGRYYEWLLVSLDPGTDLNRTRIPFYVLSEAEFDVATQALNRLGLYADLLRFGGKTEAEARKKIADLAKK